jgi:hypothetical protein
MTKKIENTKWAKSFKEECPSQYKLAIRLVLDPELLVRIVKNDEECKNHWRWAILVVKPEIAHCQKINDFWLDSLGTKKEALALCKEMSWKIKN